MVDSLWKSVPCTLEASDLVTRGPYNKVHMLDTVRIGGHVTFCFIDHHVAFVKPFLYREPRFCLQLMHNK